LQVTRSAYYRSLKKPKFNNDERLITEVKAIHTKARMAYGSRRISKYLQMNNYNVGRYKARSLMRKAGIECKQRRRYKVTTQSDSRLSIAENILNREFSVTQLNRIWLADITYIWTNEG